LRATLKKYRQRDPNISYRGKNPGRLDNLTDAVFGIAITLLIFNLVNPNSFEDLVAFTKTLPAFLVSITFLMIVWKEHVNFSQIYGLNNSWIQALNVLFIALIIFYVYPLRFWTLFLTNFLFETNISIQIKAAQVPDLMIYYGCMAMALYVCLLFFYLIASRNRAALSLNPYEILHTRMQVVRMLIFVGVPFVSIVVVFFLRGHHVGMASMLGGMTYILYTPLMIFWTKNYKAKLKKLNDSTLTPIIDPASL
jgi:uncharacterized membrane protein